MRDFLDKAVDKTREFLLLKLLYLLDHPWFCAIILVETFCLWVFWKHPPVTKVITSCYEWVRLDAQTI